MLAGAHANAPTVYGACLIDTPLPRDAVLSSLPPLGSPSARYNSPGLSPVPLASQLALAGGRALVDHANEHPLPYNVERRR